MIVWVFTVAELSARANSEWNIAAITKADDTIFLLSFNMVISRVYFIYLSFKYGQHQVGIRLKQVQD
jgi:hypothetical protein